MPKQIKRIPLDSLQLTDLSSSSGSPDDVTPPTTTFPAVEPLFSFKLMTLSPGVVEFSFPAEDAPRVKAWFTGDFSHVSTPESTTLKKNMTAAVNAALQKYNDAALSRNLFASPFRICWRYRLFDGSYAYPASPVLVSPGSDSPLLVITSHSLYEKFLHTDITYSKNPSRLLMSLPVPSGGDDFRDIITDIDFLMTRPVSLFDKEMEVAGIRSVTVDETRQRVWKYEALAAESIEAAARADNDFRVVASVSFRDVMEGKYSDLSPFPLDAGTLGRFSLLPKASIGSSSGATEGGASGDILSGWRPYLHFSTPPLDLGLPETAKSVTDLLVRGVFSRREIKVSLFGSHHRENWRMIAKSEGPYIRRLRRAPFRWFKVEIELPLRRDDFIDVLTFQFFTDP